LCLGKTPKTKKNQHHHDGIYNWYFSFHKDLTFV
jgi:hypothetical protein